MCNEEITKEELARRKSSRDAILSHFSGFTASRTDLIFNPQPNEEQPEDETNYQESQMSLSDLDTS